MVMFQWMLSYLTYQRGARLITGIAHPRLVGHTDEPKFEHSNGAQHQEVVDVAPPSKS